MTALRAGMKVVCVGCDGSRFTKEHWDRWCIRHGVVRAQRGEVYTIRETRVAADASLRVRLVEIVNPRVPFRDAPLQEPWFPAVAFRPAVERKTSIDVFTAMLAPEPNKCVKAPQKSKERV